MSWLSHPRSFSLENHETTTIPKGNLCEGTEKFLYPIHRSGVGACTENCPAEESAASVNGYDPKDKEKMVCMAAEDYADFTMAGEKGFTDFETLTPVNAYKFGVCNYKYRTFKVCLCSKQSVVC